MRARIALSAGLLTFAALAGTTTAAVGRTSIGAHGLRECATANADSVNGPATPVAGLNYGEGLSNTVNGFAERKFYPRRGYEDYAVPASLNAIEITAIGGGGGGGLGGNPKGSAGAEITGTLAVQPGDVLRFGVAGTGQEWRNDGRTPTGGWGGLGGFGGDGGTEDHSDVAAAGGGGATTIELIRNGQTIPVMVAGGGGGDGIHTGGGTPGGAGGNGGANASGCIARGGDGGRGGTAPGYPAGGGAGGVAGSLSTPEGQDGPLCSGNTLTGGGGGGGVHGGRSGGCSAFGATHSGGGGGGAGSSMIGTIVDNPHIAPADGSWRGKNGEVILLVPLSAGGR